MADIILHTSSDSGVTCVSNKFIDEYMKDANGEFVKIYLYLLRLLGQEDPDVDIGTLAEKLDHTERDVRRALAYWEESGLVSLEYNENDELAGVCFLEPTISSGNMSKSSKKKIKSLSKNKALPKRSEYSITQMKEFKENDDVEEMLFVIEKYLGRNLTVMDLNYIIYWINELSFSTDLVYYLVEYCIDKGHANIKYMDKIALDWAKNNISSVTQAKEDTITHSKIYINVCKSFGIDNRSLIKSELEYVKKWNKLSIDNALIEEACRRTIVNTNKPNFEYADKILDNWIEHSVKTLEDVKELDEEYKSKITASTSRGAKKTASKNRFNNFEARDYDYVDLEKALVNKN
ncbi:MAG: DnaD domain protein [Lachnospiraceae bacterium]|nr:DnaD domain protein [Lachnospiraceae bacterium]